MVTKKKTIEEIYKKKSQHEHILSLPDTYIGSVETINQIDMFVVQNNEIVKKPIDFNPGLYKIYDEIIVNSCDQTVRDPTCNTIKITIKNDTISIWNNGTGIPVEIHKDHNVYVPELIFGNLLTSSAYDETEERVVGGKNGYGSKLCNIFSSNFTVEVCDSEKSFKQTFSNNMFTKSEPKIGVSNKSFTCITFTPDYPRFGMKSLSKDMISLFEKRAYDCAATTSNNVSVYLNGTKIKVKKFQDYIAIYKGINKPISYLQIEQDKFIWEISVSLSENYNQVSFVNGVCTIKGGRHVDSLMGQIVSKLTDLITSKKKIEGVKSNYIKDRLTIFIRATIVNPSFDSQCKETLTTHVNKFGIKIDLPDSFIQKIYKSGIVEDIISFTNYKNQRNLIKNDTGALKKSKITGIIKLDDAKFAGTKKSNDCTLIIVEGDSAKSFAISGLSVVGREYYGVFPIRGKLLNVRTATQSQLLTNKEISELKTIIGLQIGTVYKDTSKLRYGKILILTDQDLDGFHIGALIMNMFSTWWPELMECNGFISNMRTPIVKIKKGKDFAHDFYTLQDYKLWEKTIANLSSYNIKYYKGLGTSDDTEAKQLFKNIKKNIGHYVSTCKQDTSDHFVLAFGEKQEDNRKEWIGNYDPDLVIDHTKSSITYSDFIDKSLIHFSASDIVRSIPSIVDGLKPSQRKVMFAVFKKNLKSEIKVANLAGYVSENTNYLHGESSLHGTIINLAQDYVGSNNWNLLKPNGQFGSRLLNGKDAASPRYIFTELSENATKLFKKTDNNIISYIEEEGHSIEPTFYIPILPIVLINGSTGIGTGYSTKIPCFNPDDIINNIKRILNGSDPVEMIPWYNKFTGKIKKIKDGSFTVSGCMTKVDSNTIRITELPVGTSTESYKQFLEELCTKNMYGIKEYDGSGCTKFDIDFVIKFETKECLDSFLKHSKSEIYKLLKLITPLSTRNMHLFDINNKIKKYANAEEILLEFVDIRLKYNVKRKEYLIDNYNSDLDILKNKIRFLNEIIDNTVVVYKKSKNVIIQLLEKRNYITVNNTFDYLLNMPIHSFTSEKIKDLENKVSTIENELVVISSKTSKDIFLEDIEYIEYIEELQ